MINMREVVRYISLQSRSELAPALAAHQLDQTIPQDQRVEDFVVFQHESEDHGGIHRHGVEVMERDDFSGPHFRDDKPREIY